MTNPAADIKAAIFRQLEFPRRVPLVLDRQQWWWQKGWLALSAVCVAGEDPTLIPVPDWAVGGVWVVAERDGGAVLAAIGKDAHWIETWTPQVVKPNELETSHPKGFVAQHNDAAVTRYCCNAIRHVDSMPSQGVIVIAKDADGAQAAMRQVLQDPLQLHKLIRTAVGDPIASTNHEVRSQRLCPTEGVDDVIIVNFWTHMEVA